VNNIELNKFIDRLVKAKGLDSIDRKAEKRISFDVADRLTVVIILALFAALPEDKVDSALELAEGADEKALHEFVESNVEDTAKVIKDALLTFRSAYLGA